MSEPDKPLLIKRYASRRLYNTETSDYVTLEDIAGFIRAGREVQIIDLKSGDDLTRQYLLQIIAEHESRGEKYPAGGCVERSGAQLYGAGRRGDAAVSAKLVRDAARKPVADG